MSEHSEVIAENQVTVLTEPCVGDELESNFPQHQNAFAANATATPNFDDNGRISEGDVCDIGVGEASVFGCYVDDLHGGSSGPSGYTEEEVELLRQDNEVLKSVVRRSKDATALNLQVHANIKLQSAYEGKCRELKREVQLRKQSESLLAELKTKTGIALQSKSFECKKNLDIIVSLRTELDILKERYREQEALVSILRKENARLSALCKDHSQSEIDPSVQKVVASKSLLTMSPTNFRKEVLKVNATTSMLNSVSASSAKKRSGSHAAPDSINASSGSRSISPHLPSSSSFSSQTPLEVGQRVSWKGMQGTVRFVGLVEPLGDGTWVGLELQEGRGEHSGLAFGKRYFFAPPRSSVFVRPAELSAGRKAEFESSHASLSRSQSPKSLTPNRGINSNVTSAQKSSPKFKLSSATRVRANSSSPKHSVLQSKKRESAKTSVVEESNHKNQNTEGSILIPTARRASETQVPAELLTTGSADAGYLNEEY